MGVWEYGREEPQKIKNGPLLQSLPFVTECPLTRIVHHADNLGNDRPVSCIQFSSGIAIQITALFRKPQPYLGLAGFRLGIT